MLRLQEQSFVSRMIVTIFQKNEVAFITQQNTSLPFLVGLEGASRCLLNLL